jgi:hypothetical protein
VIGSQASLNTLQGQSTQTINKVQWLKKIHTKKALSTGEVSRKYTCTAKRLKHFDYLGGLGAVETWQDLCVQ